ncbi:hypothetical protein MPER_08551, partial [Moniliophthora perniciosa FA553]
RVSFLGKVFKHNDVVVSDHRHTGYVGDIFTRNRDEASNTNKTYVSPCAAQRMEGSCFFDPVPGGAAWANGNAFELHGLLHSLDNRVMGLFEGVIVFAGLTGIEVMEMFNLFLNHAKLSKDAPSLALRRAVIALIKAQGADNLRQLRNTLSDEDWLEHVRDMVPQETVQGMFST